MAELEDLLGPERGVEQATDLRCRLVTEALEVLSLISVSGNRS